MSRQVLLLPGLLCDERVWQPQRDALVAAEHSVRVPGYPRFDSIAQVAADILSDAPDEFALAGHSLGGVIAFEILRQAADRVTHLALLDTNPAPADVGRENRRIEQAQRALAGAFRPVIERELIPGYLSRSGADVAKLRQLLLDMALTCGAERFSRQASALMERADSRPLLAEIGCPTLVLGGADDRLCPAALQQDMAARMPRARLCIVPGAGHFPGLEQPEAVNAALLELLRRGAD